MNTKKYFITLFSFIIFSIYFTLSGVFVPFIASIPQSNGGFKTLSSQNDFYKMVDNFYDPDEFYNFRTDNQNINILANFYNTLNASSNFDVLTSFNQASIIIGIITLVLIYLINYLFLSKFLHVSSNLQQ